MVKFPPIVSSKTGAILQTNVWCENQESYILKKARLREGRKILPSTSMVKPAFYRRCPSKWAVGTPVLIQFK